MSVPLPPTDAVSGADAERGDPAAQAQTPAPVVEPLTPPRPSRFRWAWWLLAYASLGLGIIGIVVPGLPTVPFVLLSAFAAARGSQRLHARLLAHRQFGPMIRDWQAHGAVSRRAKRLAVSMMALCAVIMILTSPKWWMWATGIAIMTTVAIWLWRRPEPPRD
ncbi:YbaN family protein [Pseudomonas sp. CGJS7]|uniref:YbaN family protein n=1 Tax=Pseudomonas sp. CGJS7 TaxID=3109348 RepID=UPI003007F97D